MADFTESIPAGEIACKSCGALLKFRPGTGKLVCSYCQAENEIARAAQTEIIENDLEEFLSRQGSEKEKIQVSTIKCEMCGATSTIDPKITSDKCPFCATAFVLSNGSSSAMYKPQYVLTFAIDDKKAMENFKKWLKSLWFAPNELANYVDRADRLNGMYLPFWTFDCQTQSAYSGERGIDYTVQERYTNDKGEQQTRSVTQTRWSSASGNVRNTFDDILIEGSRSLPKDLMRGLEPWDLKNVVDYKDQYLVGFRTENFQTDLPSAYQESKQRMEPIINQTIRVDIGGDRQNISSVSTTYNNPTFKYILLPVWISAFRYNDKVYQFLVNARTGEVQGKRPFSTIKIAIAVIVGIIIIVTLYSISK
jgi:LSD1 subclass zinc finger protein